MIPENCAIDEQQPASTEGCRLDPQVLPSSSPLPWSVEQDHLLQRRPRVGKKREGQTLGQGPRSSRAPLPYLGSPPQEVRLEPCPYPGSEECSERTDKLMRTLRLPWPSPPSVEQPPL